MATKLGDSGPDSHRSWELKVLHGMMLKREANAKGWPRKCMLGKSHQSEDKEWVYTNVSWSLSPKEKTVR